MKPMKAIRWRATFIFVLTLLAAYAVSPTIIYFLQPIEVRNDEEAFLSKLPSWLPQGHVKLGLDLQGGVQLVLGVNTDGAITSRLNRVAKETKRWSDESKLGVEKAFVKKDKSTLAVKLKKGTDFGEFNSKFRKQFSYLVKTDGDDNSLNYVYNDKDKKELRKSALEQAERVISSRVNNWGVSEPMINRRADGNILVQLPGFKDPERAKELLGRTAELSFKIVADNFKGFESLRGNKKNRPEGIYETDNGGQLAFSSEDKIALKNYLSSKIPQGSELIFQRKILSDTKTVWTSFVVNAAAEVTGNDIHDASVSQGTQMDPTPFVSLNLNPQGARRFANITGENKGKRMAIVLDDIVESAPVIQQRIAGGVARITLGGSGRSFDQVMEDGKGLALILKSGAVPARIDVLEQRQVGATLGPELADKGVKGVLIGLLFVLFFMVVYYRRPGVIACFALVLNALFLLALMAGLGFALTLPGIAGFILTLGMAVDANVLINERIRQELREGRHYSKSIDVGFKKVLSTILDANITTLIAAIVLIETNPSGPIRGFAITIILGLIVSMFTSLYCTRLFFDVALLRVAEKRVKSWLGVLASKTSESKFNFSYLSISKPITIAAIILSLVVVGVSSSKGLDLGVDFAGGTEMTVKFSKDISADKIRTVARNSNIDDPTLQTLDGSESKYLVRYEEKEESSQEDMNEEEKASASDIFLGFKSNLLKDLSDYKPDIQQVGFVGPQVGEELRMQGFLSLFYAILAILIYIALRFDMRFAPGAMVKMLIDVCLMLGFYAFFRAPFDLVAVAAFLTVIGYSVNDTIVIYDRIRENLTLYPRRSLSENINFALNETLTRSINTSLTTILSLFGILILSDGQIWHFAMAMAIGVAVAAFSSIFIASNFVLLTDRWMKLRKEQNRVSAKTRALAQG